MSSPLFWLRSIAYASHLAKSASAVSPYARHSDAAASTMPGGSAARNSRSRSASVTMGLPASMAGNAVVGTGY
ncbi:hypothetical protein DFJ74DRAFT_683411 [Hyaloraphidium curvatum]|nr:hypothetical protein DFJ74DRAFT_683411 [Hyaloraphidium curvatum]